MVVVLLLLKCYVFDALVAQPESVHWEWYHFLTKTAAAALIALPVVMTARRYPVFVILILTDIWLIINIIYNRAYHLFITWHLFSIMQNMSGFGDSILPYCSDSLLFFPALTLPALLCFFWETKPLRWYEDISIVLLAALLSIGGAYSRWKHIRPYLNGEPFSWEWVSPCTLPQSLSAHVSESEKQVGKYIYYHSILAYPLFMAYDALHTTLSLQGPEPLNEEEEAELRKVLSPIVPANKPEGNLLIVLLESFESWLLDVSDADGRPICPEWNNYVNTHPVLHVKDVRTQISYGMSSDGQLIINTGLYPIWEGVTCVDYPFNTYPNLAHFYPHSAVVNPCRNVWNQTIISSAYGYQRLIEPDTDYRFEWNDSVTVNKIIEAFETTPSPCCIMGITVSGHIPFDSSPDDIPIPDTVPTLFQNYMKTAHFTDRQVGRLLAWADTAQVMQNSVIAITGDHRIFHAWLTDDIREYGLRANLPFGTDQAGCPLIIVAPGMDAPIHIERAKQIDVFTTILDFIGQKSYCWKGMGHSVLELHESTDEEVHLRRNISDKLIRMNYFSTLH